MVRVVRMRGSLGIGTGKSSGRMGFYLATGVGVKQRRCGFSGVRMFVLREGALGAFQTTRLNRWSAWAGAGQGEARARWGTGKRKSLEFESRRVVWNSEALVAFIALYLSKGTRGLKQMAHAASPDEPRAHMAASSRPRCSTGRNRTAPHRPRRNAQAGQIATKRRRQLYPLCCTLKYLRQPACP
ncbi:hypothetical protein EJ04DRAFT_270908 [Polyplosphaeria fusca]|uniref:Uncharacterized protein n=1 Tax=Polyplosphaeria fusca TaxID=682080 RepID=A0A9P4V2N9_9PLEO|nr:hypothetical protein EJ04DRAFT_270908 [Polyplosphaeria fusca]